MPADVHIYFEGDRLLKPGFDAFFRELREQARSRRCHCRLISAKSGEQARQDFETACEADRGVWPVLLIDSEGPLTKKSGKPHFDRTFWMVEMMEAWFHADKDALEDFYGRGFRKSSLKSNPNVEKIPKADLERGLKAATRGTPKGTYHKTSHGPKLLEMIDPKLVREAAPNCDRFFQAVLHHLN